MGHIRLATTLRYTQSEEIDAAAGLESRLYGTALAAPVELVEVRRRAMTTTMSGHSEARKGERETETDPTLPAARLSTRADKAPSAALL